MKNRQCSYRRRLLIGSIVMAMTLTTAFPGRGFGMLVPVQSADDMRSADMKTIQLALESEIVRQRLTELKLSPEQINSRLIQLSDEQVHQTAMQIRTLNPGGDGGGGILITVLVIAILVALFMYVFKRV